MPTDLPHCTRSQPEHDKRKHWRPVNGMGLQHARCPDCKEALAWSELKGEFGYLEAECACGGWTAEPTVWAIGRYDNEEGI